MPDSPALFFDPRPPLPSGIMFPKAIMLVQAVLGFLVCAVHMFWFVYSISAEWPVDLWSLGVALVVAALAGTSFILAVQLRPGAARLWRGSLMLQGGVGAFWLLGGILIMETGTTTLQSVFENPFLLFAAVCWTAFALLLLPSARPRGSAPSQGAD